MPASMFHMRVLSWPTSWKKLCSEHKTLTLVVTFRVVYFCRLVFQGSLYCQWFDLLNFGFTCPLLTRSFFSSCRSELQLLAVEFRLMTLNSWLNITESETLLGWKFAGFKILACISWLSIKLVFLPGLCCSRSVQHQESAHFFQFVRH